MKSRLLLARLIASSRDDSRTSLVARVSSCLAAFVTKTSGNGAETDKVASRNNYQGIRSPSIRGAGVTREEGRKRCVSYSDKAEPRKTRT